MSLTAVVLILVAAVAHAGWNLCSKQASAVSTAGFIWLLAVLAGIAVRARGRRGRDTCSGPT